jgi:hypothetical protein
MALDMPIAVSLGFTESQARAVYDNRKDQLDEYRTQALEKAQYASIFNAIAEAGSLRNAGDVSGLARLAGCTLEQAAQVVSEIEYIIDQLRVE